MAIDLSTTELTVEHGARIFDAVEPRLEKVHSAFLELLPVMDAARGHVIFGGLETGEIKGEIMAIAGDIGAVYKRIYLLHRRVTDRCIEKNIDVPQTRDGGR